MAPVFFPVASRRREGLFAACFFGMHPAGAGAAGRGVPVRSHRRAAHRGNRAQGGAGARRSAASLVPHGFRAPGTRRRPERQARKGAIGGSHSGAWRISERRRRPATNRLGGFPANRSPCVPVARCARGLSAVRQRVIDGDMGGRSCAIRPTGGVVRRRTRERSAVARRGLLSGRARRLSPRRVTVLGFGWRWRAQGSGIRLSLTP